MSLTAKLQSFSAVHKLFPRKQNIELLVKSITLLRLSTFYRLQKKYLVKHNLDTANALAVAVVTAMVHEPPRDEIFRVFYRENRDEIRQEVLNAHKQDGVSGLSGCASYLYAAEILYGSLMKGGEGEINNRHLRQQAEKLGIMVPSREEICGSADVDQCINAIYSFATAFYYSNIWNGTSLALEKSVQQLQFHQELVNRMLAPKPVVPPLPEPIESKAHPAAAAGSEEPGAAENVATCAT